MAPERIYASTLRQTCNRCRKLKVRCQRNSASHGTQLEAMPACVRCYKAGAECAFSAPHLSGRPPTIQYGRVWPISRPPHSSESTSVSSPSESPLSICSTTSLANTSQDSMAPFTSDSWSGTWLEYPWDMSILQNGFDSISDTLLPLDWDGSIVPDKDHELAHKPNDSSVDQDTSATNLVSDREARISAAAADQTDQDDTTVDVNTLCDLNIQIHEIASTATTSVSSEKLTYVTCRMLKALEQVTDSFGRRGKARAKSCRSTRFPAIVESLERDFRKADIYQADDFGTHGDFDIGTVLMVLATYNRLLDLFKKVLVAMHMNLAEARSEPHTPPKGDGPVGGGDAIMDEDYEKDCLEAMAVMKTELIKHLLGRLIRGFRQFVQRSTLRITALPSGSVASSVPPSQPLPSELPSSSTNNCHFYASPMPSNSNKQGEIRSEPDTNLPGPVAWSFIEATTQKEQALNAHVELFKLSLNQDGGKYHY